jgi:putative PIN family toxin of toxin-antitoxin system
MPKIVFDTNIYISAFIFGGSIKEHVFDILEVSTICTSKELIQEIFATLEKSKFSMTLEIKKEVVNFLSITEFFTPTQSVNICRDPKDNFVLELAEEANADYIITGDKDLLVLKNWKGCKILKLSEFLALQN